MAFGEILASIGFVVFILALVNMWVQVLRDSGSRERPLDDGRRTAASASPQSPLEERMLSLLRRHGFPEPSMQYPVRVGWVESPTHFHIDFAYPELRLALETDGRAYHTGRESRDATRDRRLEAVGWRTLRFSWDDVVNRPSRVVTALEGEGLARVATRTWKTHDLGFDEGDPYDRRKRQ